MPDLVVISDAGLLIALSSIHQLDLLNTLFGKIMIPEAVYHEVVLLGKGRPGEREVKEAAWIQRKQVNIHGFSNLLLDKLDAGERESIVLAYDTQADYVILDERLARRRAQLLGLTVLGTLGVLLLAKKAGQIQCVADLLFDLERMAFRMSDQVKAAILQKAGE